MSARLKCRMCGYSGDVCPECLTHRDETDCRRRDQCMCGVWEYLSEAHQAKMDAIREANEKFFAEALAKKERDK